MPKNIMAIYDATAKTLKGLNSEKLKMKNETFQDGHLWKMK
jgi:hypothetical protein